MPDFLSAIEDRVLVCDGAMGTMLYTKGVFISRCFDELNLSAPDLVREVHTDYVKAGADIIETNTFNSTGVSMADYRLEPFVYELNFAGAKAARKAVEIAMAKDSSRPRFVAGAMGPTNRTCSISR